jgi:outer membrane protein assembly factor BamB
MFRGDTAHTGVYRSEGPRHFHRVKWKFPTGDRIVSSPILNGNVIYFGGDDGNVYAVNANDGHQIWKHKTGGPVPSTPAVEGETLYVGSYDGKFHSLDTRTGATRWKFSTEGERRFEAKGLHGNQPKTQTMADVFDIFLSSPVVARGTVYFGSGDGNVYALDAVSGALKWKFKTGDVVHASPAYADGVLYFGSWDSYFYAVDAESGKEKWRFHGGEDPLFHNQVGFQSSPAVGASCTLAAATPTLCNRRGDRQGEVAFQQCRSWVITSPAVAQGKVIFGTSDSSLYHVLDAETGKPFARQQGKAYLFSSPSVAGNVVFVGVLNGTLEARDLHSGDLLWTFETEASKRNIGWALTADRKFNVPMLFRSGWREAPTVGIERQFSVGSIFASPLIADGVVYFGSTDGALYAVE